MTLRILLDTNALFGNKWRTTEAMKTFARLCAGGFVQCFVPHVVENEVISQGVAHQKAEIAVMQASFRKLKKYSLPELHYNALSKALNDLDRDKDEILSRPQDDFQRWCESIGAMRVPLGISHADDVLKAYFYGDAPFRTIKSREDIPDAFIYQVIRDLAAEPLLVVCEDGNLRKACEKLDNVTAFKTIDQILAHESVARAIAQESGKMAEPRTMALKDCLPKEAIKKEFLLAKPVAIERTRRLLSALGQRSALLDTRLAPQIMAYLFRSQVESDLIASHDHRAQVDACAVGEIHYDFTSASFYGDGKFGVGFLASTTLQVSYYVNERAAHLVRGRSIARKQVYKDEEEVKAILDAHISGRAVLKLDADAVADEDVLSNLGKLDLDEISRVEIFLDNEDDE